MVRHSRGGALRQGDLIFGCPVLGWRADAVSIAGFEETEVLKGVSEVSAADVVVMTQSVRPRAAACHVVLCPHYSLEQYKLDWARTMTAKEQRPTERAWKKHYDDIKNGFVWNLTLLNHAELNREDIGNRVVEFHEVFTIPRSFIELLLRQRMRPRLRLKPPYREHLSQAFARFFMRVGLPVPVDDPPTM